MLFRLASLLYVSTLFLSTYSVPSRWGQAVTILNDALVVYGGKTDEYHLYSYASAPPTNDILYLPLSSAFTGTNPPWQVLPAAQGPTLSWHTISPLNQTYLLVFGGDPGPNSPQVLPGLADSAAVLNLGSLTSPKWTLEPQGWANQPPRRLYHTSSYANQKIYIIGGAKADGSGLPVYDHYVFDTVRLRFTLLPTPGGPEDLVGHVALVTSDGLLLILGGFSPSASRLLPLSTIYVLDTKQPNPAWSTIHTMGVDVPPGRRAFAAAVTPGGKIVIHGGADATMQTTMGDGWMLDLNSKMWRKVDALSNLLGPRTDHFAVPVGETILFGFGFGANMAAPGPLAIFEASNGQVIPTFSPPTPAISPTSLMPPGVGTARPSTTRPPPTRTGSSAASPTRSTSGGPVPINDKASKPDYTAIAVGSSLSILAVLAAAFIASHYVRRRRRREELGPRKFHPLGDSQFMSADEDKDIPIAGAIGQRPNWLQRKNTQFLNALGMRTDPYQRRGTVRKNLLADEDTRVFDIYGAPHARDWTAGSSWSLFSVLGGAAGAGRGQRSREGSWNEAQVPLVERGKRTSGDNQAEPLMEYADGRPSSSSRPAHASSGSPLGYWYQRQSNTSAAYVDPFEDPQPQESVIDLTEFSESGIPDLPPVPPPKPTLARQLSPLFEQTSRYSSSDPVSSSSTQNTFARKSSEEARPTQSRSSQRTEAVRRSDSWWSRISRSAFQDRQRTGDPGRLAHRMEFRDPNPPPRLDAIRESMHSVSYSGLPEPPEKQSGGVNLAHGRSISSIRTADSEAIERIGAMIVVQRGATVDSHQTMLSSGPQSPVSDVASPSTQATIGLPWVDDDPKADIDAASQGSDIAMGHSHEELPSVKPRQSVKYGLMPRPSLFVANPDHSQSRSSI